MKVPGACIPGRLKQQTHNDIVRIADALRSKLMRGCKCLKTKSHTGAAFESLCLSPEHAHQMPHRITRRSRNSRGGVSLLTLYPATLRHYYFAADVACANPPSNITFHLP